jgi:soluble lytic murein transglycosylase
MSHVFGPWPCLLVVAALAGSTSNALAAAPHKHVQPAKKPEVASAARPERKAAAKTEAKKTKHAERVAAKRHKKAGADDRSTEKAEPQLTGDAAVMQDVIDLQRHGKTGDATDAEKKFVDPAAQKLAEWFILRHSESQASFGRYAAFISDNPAWPGVTLLRRRAEARLWNDKIDAATVHAFTSDHPLTAKGRLALARVLLGEGDRDGAKALVQAAYRSEDLSERTESDLLEAFRDLLDRGDDRARMQRGQGQRRPGIRPARFGRGRCTAGPRLCAVPRAMAEEQGEDRRGRPPDPGGAERDHGAAGH